MTWTPVEKELPRPGFAVLMSYLNAMGNRRTMIGHHQPAYTVEAGENCHEALELDYDDHLTAYEPGGWYEHSEWHPDFAYWHLPEHWQITHWHPLPPAP